MTGSRTEDEAAIRAVIEEMTDAFNRRDAKAATRMYTADADLVTVRGERYTGAAEMERGLSAIFASRARQATLATRAVTVRFVTPDVAVAHVTNELSGLVGADGARLPAHEELSVRVFVKQDSAWRVAVFHNTMLQPF